MERDKAGRELDEAIELINRLSAAYNADTGSFTERLKRYSGLEADDLTRLLAVIFQLLQYGREEDIIDVLMVLLKAGYDQGKKARDA